MHIYLYLCVYICSPPPRGKSPIHLEHTWNTREKPILFKYTPILGTRSLGLHAGNPGKQPPTAIGISVFGVCTQNCQGFLCSWQVTRTCSVRRKQSGGSGMGM